MRSHRVVSVSLAVLAATMLAGCDNKPKRAPSDTPAIKFNIPLDKEHSASIGNQLPADLPAYAQVYPGAEVLGVTTMDTMPNAPFKGVIQYNVAADPAAVLAFYKKNAEAAGLTTISGAPSGPVLHYGANKAGPDKGFLSIDIAAQKDGKTFVQQRYK